MARPEERGPSRDAAGVGPHHRPGVHLTPLRKLGDWKVVEGEADIRGWEVRTVGGRKIGTVQDLLVDREAGEVVMLDIDLDGTDRHSLAPIRAAQIDRGLRVVRIDSSDLQGESLPSLSRRATTDDEARDFNEQYRRSYGAKGFGADREYIVDRDEDEVHFGHRPTEHAPPPPPPAAADFAPSLASTETHPAQRSVHYQKSADGVEERVVETRPVVVEEVVVRRRILSADEAAKHRGERHEG